MHFLALSACGISSPGDAFSRDCEERSDRHEQEVPGDVKLKMSAVLIEAAEKKYTKKKRESDAFETVWTGW